MRGTLQKLRAVDGAWNARAWSRYAELLDDDIEVWVSGEEQPHNKAAHLDRARTFCESFPDAVRHADYLDLFASLDGLNSLSVARFTGSARSILRFPGPAPTVPTTYSFSVPMMLACRWRAGRIIRLREHIDQILMARQLGGIPEIPSMTGGSSWP